MVAPYYKTDPPEAIPHRFADGNADLEYIRETSLEAHLGVADLISVEYVPFDKEGTQSVPQGKLAELFDDVAVPQYGSPVSVPAIWQQEIKQEDIKKYKFQIIPDVKMTISLVWFQKKGLRVKAQDRFRIQGLLYEVRDVDERKSMGNIALNQELFLYSVDGPALPSQDKPL